MYGNMPDTDDRRSSVAGFALRVARLELRVTGCTLRVESCELERGHQWRVIEIWRFTGYRMI